MNRARPVLAVLAIAACLAVPVAPAAAQAVFPAIPTGTDCLRPPEAESPTQHPAGWLDPGPASPVEGDPFDPASGATLYDTYGYAGYGTHMFDPGCMDASTVWNPANDAANGMTAFASMITAASVRATRIVTEGGIGSLWDPLQAEGQRILGQGVLIPLMFLGALATGLLILSRSRQGDVAGEAKSSGVTAVILLAGLACAVYSMTVGATFDRGVGEAFKASNTLATQTIDGGRREPADALAANMSTVRYDTWAMSTFGGGPAAAEFGPALFKAGALTRAEQAQIDADPAAATRILDEKRAEYKRVAKQVEDKYPQAYQVLAGNNTGHRAWHALAGLLASLVAAGYLIVCLVKMLWSMVVVRVAIGVAPLVAIIAQFPRWQHLAFTLLGWVVEAVVKAVAYGFVFAVFLAGAVGGILDPARDWHPWVKIAALVIAVFALQSLLSRLGLGRAWDIGWGKHGPARERPQGETLPRAAAAETAARAGGELATRAAYAAGPGPARSAAGAAAGATRRAPSVVWATRTVGQPMLAAAATRTTAAAVTSGATGGMAAPLAVTAGAASTAVSVARAGQAVQAARRGQHVARAASSTVEGLATRRVDPARAAVITTLPQRGDARRYGSGTLGAVPTRRALPPPPPRKPPTP